jgi:transcriptional regulator with XRE-family HTH domain
MKQFVTRIERVLELMYSGVQQREAARQLGVSVSLLSATLSGSRRPSKTLVTALAKMPEVNERWLLDGIGEPLSSGGTSLPVVSRLPRSATTPWDDVASNTETFRISENQFSTTRYWWKLSAPTLRSWGTAGQKRTRVAVGDYLLLETDSQQMAALTGQDRLAITAHADIESGKPCWGFLTDDLRFASFREMEQKRVENEQRPKIQKQSKPKSHRRNLSHIFDGKTKSTTREKVSSPEKKETHLPPMSFPPKDKQPPQIAIENLRALVIEMTSTSPFRLG